MDGLHTHQDGLPSSFRRLAAYGIHIGGQVELLNELRGTGGSLFALGSFIVVSAFSTRLRQASGIVSALFYVSYGLSRALSLVLDGRPTSLLIVVMLGELSIGGLVLSTVLKHRRSLFLEAR